MVVLDHLAISLKWGTLEVKGLDGKRAEAIGLQPTVHKLGPASANTVLPPILREPGPCARFIRRTAELMLQNSERWRQIELNTRDTNQHYKELLVSSRVREAAYRMAAEILGKILERPGLLNIWETSCPSLLKSKTRELELQAEGTPAHLEALKEKLRIDLIYDAVAQLKAIEHERPIRASDIEVKYKKVAQMAAEEQGKILKQEQQLAAELKEIGDGSDTIVKYGHRIEAALPTNALDLRQQELLALPLTLFQMTNLELLDLGNNGLTELPAEVGELKTLKKLYLDGNQLTTLPCELYKIETTLKLLGLAGNPLEDPLMQLYLAGLEVLMAHLKSVRRARKQKGGDGSPSYTRLSGCHTLDLFNTSLPAYEAEAEEVVS